VTVIECTTARQAWDALEQSFSAQTNARRAQLMLEMTSIAKTQDEELHRNTSRAKALQAELATAGQPMDENTIILYTLRGLRTRGHQDFPVGGTTIPALGVGYERAAAHRGGGPGDRDQGGRHHGGRLPGDRGGAAGPPLPHHMVELPK